MAIEFYCQRTSSNDTYSGSTREVPKDYGNNATTDGTQVVSLPDKSDLTDVVDNEDTIRIDGETTGKGNNSDIFTITAHDDGASTVTTSETPGNNGAGHDWCIGGPWNTLQQAMNIVDAGDKVWVKADAAYDDDNGLGSSYCFQDVQQGSADAPILFEGYKTTPGDSEALYVADPSLDPADFDSTYLATVDGAANSLAAGLHLANANAFYAFRHMNFKLMTNGVGTGAFSEGWNVTFRNCRYDGCKIGLYTDYGNLVESCYAVNNTSFGMSMTRAGTVLNCTLATNLIGINAAGVTAIGCRIYDNTRDGIFSTYNNYAYIWNIINCTLIGKNKPAGYSGINIKNGANLVLVNNIIHNWETGVSVDNSRGGNQVIRNNLFGDNTSPRSGIPAGTGDVVTTDPRFVDEANGDFRLWPVSPAKIAGYPPEIDIGAEQNDWTHPKKGGAWQYIHP